MSRRPARFTEADIRRAAKVAKQLGMAVEIKPDGTIRIVPYKGELFDGLSDSALRASAELAKGNDIWPRGSSSRTSKEWSPEAALTMTNRQRLLQDFMPSGELRKMRLEDYRGAMALSESDRDAFLEEYWNAWAASLTSCPLNKRERKALQELSLMPMGELISFDQISVGLQTAERLEGRGFLKVNYRTDRPDPPPGYVLTLAGLKATKELLTEGSD
jgi:hypothetical protein